jgi:hypothetical protein
MNILNVITDRSAIARLALDGDGHSFDPIGGLRGDINEMEPEVGLPRVHRAYGDDDIAVYSDGTRHALVANANGPIIISIGAGCTAKQVATAKRNAAMLTK